MGTHEPKALSHSFTILREAPVSFLGTAAFTCRSGYVAGLPKEFGSRHPFVGGTGALMLTVTPKPVTFGGACVLHGRK